MRRSGLFFAALVLSALFLVPGKPTGAQDTITESQFKALHVLLSSPDHGKTTLVAVQGDKKIEITDFALMKKIALSGIKTTFYLRNDKTGEMKELVVYQPSETGKSMNLEFCKVVCNKANICSSCAQIFGQSICR